MRKTKILLSTMLSLLFMACVMIPSALADEPSNNEGQPYTLCVQSDKETADLEDIVNISVVLKPGAHISAMTIDLLYDTENFEYQGDAAKGTALSGGYADINAKDPGKIIFSYMTEKSLYDAAKPTVMMTASFKVHKADGVFSIFPETIAADDIDGTDVTANCNAVGITIGLGWWTTTDEGTRYNLGTGDYKTGWLDWGGARYYFSPETGLMQTGWQLIGGKWYYFEDSDDEHLGEMVHDAWAYYGNEWCYLGSDGAMLTNAETPDGYYVNASGYWVTGWVETSGGWRYYLDSGGYQTGWFYWGDAWYYLSPETGIMQTGWLYSGGSWYYLYGSGEMAHDTWAYYGNEWCYLGSDGAMLTDTVTPDGYYVDASGYWVP